MQGPKAIVLPFGLPKESRRGLGLGLAALVHLHARVGGATVGLAQMQSNAPPEDDEAPSFTLPQERGFEPVEAFFTPAAWRAASASSEAPPSVEVVLTGGLEPPTDGRGLLLVSAFDPRSGALTFREEVTFDEDDAGKVIVEELEKALKGLEGDLGEVRALAELPWDALEDVLLGERAALADPLLQAAHDPLAALMYFGRALAEAPACSYLARRMAAIAVDLVLVQANHGLPPAQRAAAARRALERAVEDAPNFVEPLDALALLCARTGDHEAAERYGTMVLERDAFWVRAYGTLSESRRARKDYTGALAIVQKGLDLAPNNTYLAVEQAIGLAESGDEDGAMVALRGILLRDKLHPGAFVNLAQLAKVRDDKPLAQSLIDEALAAESAHPDVFRRAIELALGAEVEGLARSVRVSTLAKKLLAIAPGEPWALFMLAQACAQMGEKEAAVARLLEVERVAAGTPLGAEALRGLFLLREPVVAAEVDAVLRLVATAQGDELDVLAGRAQRLALAHGVWMAYFAAGIAERRREKWSAAREAFKAVLGLAPGVTAAREELIAIEEAERSQGRAPSEPPPSMGAFARLRQTLTRAVGGRRGGKG